MFDKSGKMYERVPHDLQNADRSLVNVLQKSRIPAQITRQNSDFEGKAMLKQCIVK